jgi:hypothetical protein
MERDQSCTPNPTLARKSIAEILRRLASRGQKPVGEALGKSETWISRWKSADAQTCADLLAVLGLKIVPAENECHAPAYIAHLRYFARIGVAVEQEAAPDESAPPPVAGDDARGL